MIPFHQIQLSLHRLNLLPIEVLRGFNPVIDNLDPVGRNADPLDHELFEIFRNRDHSRRSTDQTIGRPPLTLFRVIILSMNRRDDRNTSQPTYQSPICVRRKLMRMDQCHSLSLQ